MNIDCPGRNEFNQLSELLPQQSLSPNNSMESKIVLLSLKKLTHNLVREVASPSKIKEWVFEAVNICENKQILTPAMQELKNDCKYKTLSEIASKYLSDNFSPSKELFIPQLIRILKEQTKIISSSIEIEKNELKSMIESSQLEWSPVQRDEMLRLVMHFYKTQRAAQNKCFDGYAIDITELPSFISAKTHLANPQDDNLLRLQVMVRNEVHYTAVDMELSRNELNGCVMDAYGEPKAAIVEEILKKAGFNVYSIGTGETLQKDTRSCSLFALDHLIKSSKNPSFFKQLRQNARYDEKTLLSKVSWYDLPYRFVKYAQDAAFFKTYAEKNPYVADAVPKEGIESKLQDFKQIIIKQFHSLPASTLQNIACAHFLA